MNEDSRGTVKQVAAIMRRYKDAYRVARATVAFGNTIKSAGIVTAVLFALIGIGLMSSGGPDAYLKTTLGGVAISVGLLGGAIIFVLGILISAQGQTLMASLDSAVYGSTFIVNEHRAILMSLPEE